MKQEPNPFFESMILEPPPKPNTELMFIEFNRSKAAQMEALSKSIAGMASALAECAKLPNDSYTSNPAREIAGKILLIADSLTSLSMTQFYDPIRIEPEQAAP
jgi:hypothetical protein